MGATLYYALTSSSPRTIRESRLPDRWRELVLRCVEEAPEHRFRSAREFLAALEAARDGSSSSSSVGPEGVRCTNCGASNRVGENYCRRCGAGLYRSCPRCTTSNEIGTRFCVHCGLDVVAWMRSEDHLRAAQEHLDAFRYEQAIASGRAAEEAFEGREEVAELLGIAAKRRTALLNAQDEAEACLDTERYEDAKKRWLRVLSIDPDHKRAKASLGAIPELVRRRDLTRAIREVREAVAARNWAAAESAELRMLELASEADVHEVAPAEDELRELEKRVSRTRRAFDEAFRRDRPEEAPARLEVARRPRRRSRAAGDPRAPTGVLARPHRSARARQRARLGRSAPGLA